LKTPENAGNGSYNEETEINARYTQGMAHSHGQTEQRSGTLAAQFLMAGKVKEQESG
jgi:hypothetical protein